MDKSIKTLENADILECTDTEVTSSNNYWYPTLDFIATRINTIAAKY